MAIQQPKVPSRSDPVPTSRTCAVCKRVYVTEQDYLTGTSRWRVCSAKNLWFNCGCGSTMMILKGKYPWYSPGKVMSEDARGMFNSIAAFNELPALPTAVAQLQQSLKDQNVAPKDIATVLRDDPGLAAQLLLAAERLRVVRNADNPPIKSIEHAVVYVGFKNLDNMLAQAALRNIKLPKSAFRENEFWNHSFIAGAIAEALVRRHKLPIDPDAAYLAGSLCNIGKIAAAYCCTPELDRISREIHDPKQLSTWRQAEMAINAPEHTSLGEVAASLWGMPDFVIQANKSHHVTPTLKNVPLSLDEVVAIANQMAHFVAMAPHRIERDILTAYLLRTKTSEADQKEFMLSMMRMVHKFPA